MLTVPTAHGTEDAAEGDWIVKGLKAFIVCERGVFAETYEAVADPASTDGVARWTTTRLELIEALRTSQADPDACTAAEVADAVLSRLTRAGTGEDAWALDLADLAASTAPPGTAPDVVLRSLPARWRAEAAATENDGASAWRQCADALAYVLLAIDGDTVATDLLASNPELDRLRKILVGEPPEPAGREALRAAIERVLAFTEGDGGEVTDADIDAIADIAARYSEAAPSGPAKAAGEPQPASPLPPGIYGRVELPGFRKHTGWMTEGMLAGQAVMVISDRDGEVLAEYIPGPASRFVRLPVPVPSQPGEEPEPPRAIGPGVVQGCTCGPYDECDECADVPDPRPF